MILFQRQRPPVHPDFFDLVEERIRLDREGLVEEVRGRRTGTDTWTPWDVRRGIVPVLTPPIWGYDCVWYDGPHPTLCLGWLTVFWQWHDTKDGHCKKCRSDVHG